MAHKINHADILDWAKNYNGEPFDGILCDPPYELGFMGKSWDSTGIAFNVELWTELLRICKPGAHLLAFSGSRTYHRMACAIEDAGFEIRDMIEWVYGSGFPKSLNIGKAVDKIQGNERDVTHQETKADSTYHTQNVGESVTNTSTYSVTKGNSIWEGYGTALKPAHEPCVLARKPIEGNVANNCLEYGVGGLNIDGSRVQYEKGGTKATNPTLRNDNGINSKDYGKSSMFARDKAIIVHNSTGRFPANLIHDGSDEVLEVFPDGIKPSFRKGDRVSKINGIVPWNKGRGTGREVVNAGYTDSGSAARFFMSCPPSLKYDSMSVCKHLSANIVAKVLMTIQATEDPTAHSNVADLQDEQLDQNVRSATKGCEKCVTLIVQELVRIKNLAFNTEGLQVIQECIEKYKNDILTQNLVEIVTKWVNTDTTPTITNLLTLFGSALLAIDENTNLGTKEKVEPRSEQKRFLYTAKASKSERNAGLDGFEAKQTWASQDKREANSFDVFESDGRPKTVNKNHHPTVKPLSLTKYLANLIKPPTGGRLLVPFSGSGSEMIGALQAGWEYVEGVELTEEYIPIAEARIKYWLDKIDKQMEML